MSDEKLPPDGDPSKVSCPRCRRGPGMLCRDPLGRPADMHQERIRKAEAPTVAIEQRDQEAARLADEDVEEQHRARRFARDPAAEQPSGNTGELPACLRSMTPEEQAAFVPLTDAQISDALAKGVRDRELAERPWMRRPDESSEAPATPIRCSCDESIALRAALKRVLEICTTDGGQWVDIAEVAQAALGEEQSDGK